MTEDELFEKTKFWPDFEAGRTVRLILGELQKLRRERSARGQALEEIIKEVGTSTRASMLARKALGRWPGL